MFDMLKQMKGSMNLQEFLNPSPEQKRDNANYLKIALGVSDDEKAALYDLVLYLIDQLYDDSDPTLTPKIHTAYQMISTVRESLDVDLTGSEDEEDV